MRTEDNLSHGSVLRMLDVHFTNKIASISTICTLKTECAALFTFLRNIEMLYLVENTV